MDFFNLFFFSGTVFSNKGKHFLNQMNTRMKNTIFVAFALFTGAVANAQTDTTSRPQPDTTTRPVPDTTVVTMIDSSVGKAYVTNEERLQSLTTETLTPADIYPALGTFKGNGTSAGDVTITLDETNKGIVWVEGLPQGRFRAIMKRAPSTYKIPAQKSESGQAIAEGTLYVNPESNELTIVVGESFNDKQPTAVLTAAKKKNGWRYTGVKAEAAATAIPDTQKQ
jgi:hypothetical protein